MRAVLLEPGKEPAMAIVKNRLENLQCLVGGFLEMRELPEGILVLMDEEARLKHSPYNCSLPICFGRHCIDVTDLYGNLLFVGKGPSGFRSLTDVEVRKTVARLKREYV